MTVTRNHIAALVFIAQEERPSHAPKWDGAGIAHFLQQLADRGFSFGELLDRTIAHARDRNAKTPKVLLHDAQPVPAAPTTRRNPTAAEACPYCGQLRSDCGHKSERVAAGHRRTPDNADHARTEIARARHEIARARHDAGVDIPDAPDADR